MKGYRQHAGFGLLREPLFLGPRMRSVSEQFAFCMFFVEYLLRRKNKEASKKEDRSQEKRKRKKGEKESKKSRATPYTT